MSTIFFNFLYFFIRYDVKPAIAVINPVKHIPGTGFGPCFQSNTPQ